MLLWTVLRSRTQEVLFTWQLAMLNCMQFSICAWEQMAGFTKIAHTARHASCSQWRLHALCMSQIQQTKLGLHAPSIPLVQGDEHSLRAQLQREGS